FEERLDLIRLGMVNADCNAYPSTGVNHLGRLVDRLWAFCRRRLPAHASARAVDGSPGFAEHAGNPAARAPRRAGHERHLSVQSLHRCSPWLGKSFQKLARMIYKLSFSN